MSSLRLADEVVSVPLTTIDPDNAGIITASMGGRPVVGLDQFRAAQSNIAAIGVAGGGGADTLDVKFQDSYPQQINSVEINAFDGIDDGSEKLRDGAASNIRFGIPFTTTFAHTIYSVRLQMSRLGTPAIGAGGIPAVWATLETDAAGDPSGTAVGGSSRLYPTASIDTTREEITFFFDVGVDLANATDYWIVVEGNYDVSATDCIQLHYNTVAGTSGCKFFDAAWAASVNIDYWFRMEYLIFADISPAIAHAQITEGWNNIWDTLERVDINLEPIRDAVRAYYTVSGGTWTVANILTLGEGKVLPVA